MKPKIQLRLVLTLGLLVVLVEGLVLLALGSFYLERFGSEVEQRWEETLRKPGALLAQGALAADAFGQRDMIEAVVGSSLEDAMLVTAEGNILVALHPDRIGEDFRQLPDVKAEWLRVLTPKGTTERVRVGGESYLVHVAPVHSSIQTAPVLYSYLRLRVTSSDREISRLRNWIVSGSVAALIATTGALILVVNLVVSRRLMRIADALAAVTDGNYDVRLGSSRLRDEIGFVQSGFDSMVVKLRFAFDGFRSALRDLENAEQQYRILIENAEECIFVIKGGRVEFANPKCYRLLDYPAEALLGRPITDFIHDDDRAIVVARYQQRVSATPGEAPSHYEFRLVGRTGSIHWVEINVVVIEWHGSPATLNFIRDITERRRAEVERSRLQEQLSQAQKLESIGRLAGGVAHDFNNMLQIIIGNASLVMRELPANSPHLASIAEIEVSAKKSAELTGQLLAFARKQTVAPRLLNLNEVIEGHLKMLERIIGEDIALTFHPEPKAWPVLIDPSQVDQILANLCVNARDAIKANGTIIIETHNIHLDQTYKDTHPDLQPGDYVLLSVSDNGQGMDAKTLPHIFEPFFTTKEIGKGTGLGLATVFGIVRQNGGLINVYSEVGRGTTFKIYLPRGEGTQEPIKPVEPTAVGGSETILVVEDELAILTLGKRILTRHGYTVLTATSPKEALALASSHPARIDLLITDVVMPGMNGKDLLRELTQARPGLKCLFMSGYTADIIAHHGVLDRGVAFIQKPFTIQSLTEKVHAMLKSDA